MPRIKQLSPEQAQKIAAGEVVERPANVVKELIENALDAGATRITIYIEKAGKQLIRVVDNGCGMDLIDAHACFKHHATSKITSVDDLNSINTFGFRGEALSSIASVCNVTLITKTADTQNGIHLELSEGRVTSEENCSAPTGTDITMRDLLHNIPARRKFLKTNETEWRHITQLVHAVALSRRDIHITLHHDGKQILNCPPVTSHQARAAQLWDSDLAQAMIPCSAEERGIKIEGMISNYSQYRYDRNHIFFFVNNRWVKNYTLSRALMKGYANAIPATQYPAASLMITIDPAHIDVNIHPRKEEIQFLHSRIVDQIVQMAVKTALESHLSNKLQSTVRLNNQEPSFMPPPRTASQPVSMFMPEPAPNNSSKGDFTPYDFSSFANDFVKEDSVVHQKQNAPSTPEITDNLHSVQATSIPKENKIHNVLGVYDKTYIMVAHEDGILFVDQHAAHERILYERFKKRFEEVATIALMFPHMITLKKDVIDRIESHLSILHEHGIHIKRASDTELIITATPVSLKDASLNDIIDDVMSCVHEHDAIAPDKLKKQITEKVHAQMACKAAVKAGDVLDNEQIQQLLSDLEKTEHRFICAHGRPTSWLLNHGDIVKKFQRDYVSKARKNDIPDSC